MRTIIFFIALFVGVASASDKQDDSIRTFKPDEETVVVMNDVFELLR